MSRRFVLSFHPVRLLAAVAALLGLSHCGKKVSAPPSDLAPPAGWTADTPVAHALISLGEKPPDHWLNPAERPSELITRGRELALEGSTTDPDGKRSARISAYFVCTDCHTTTRENPNLSDLADPEAKLAYCREKKLPFLPGTTLAGIANRESWYNDDYAKKYRFSLGVQRARSSLRRATQLCAKECSQGRELADWEETALIAYYWSLQWTFGDLGLAPADLDALKKRAADPAQHKALMAEIKSRYAVKSPATFAQPPGDAKKGYATGKTPDPARGKAIFDLACRHCHGADGASEMHFADREDHRETLSERFARPGERGLYALIRTGTHSTEEHRPYMPNFTKERMSDQMIEDLRAWLKQ